MVILHPRFDAIAFWTVSPLIWAVFMLMSPIIMALLVWEARKAAVARRTANGV